jgi:hypothetical protein
MRRLALLALVAAAPAVAADDLLTFLIAATAAERPSQPMRADGELLTTTPDSSTRDQIAIVRNPHGDVYVELRTAGIRALIPADGNAARVVLGKGKSSEAFALDAPLGDSEFTREDLELFRTEAFRSPTIVDRGADDVTVSLTPITSQYVLQVITFDGDKHVPLTVKNYKEKISNLVKMRRDRTLTAGGGTWLPAEVSMEDFPLRTTSTMTLRWQPAADAAALFDPAALNKPSVLTWPDGK